jgi:hypothetical protein
MQSLNNEQQQLVTLLSTLYHEILPLEQELGLILSDRDQRPRIDYFYDALRALTDPNMPVGLKLERLSLEWLAYDAVAIRYLENKPLAALNPHQRHQSPETKVSKRKSGELRTTRTANRDDKDFLSKCYLRFGVMFVALFKPFADRDHRELVEELEVAAQEITDVKTGVDALGQGGMSAAELEDITNHCQDPEVRKLVNTLLEKQRYKQSENIKSALQALTSEIAKKDAQIKSVQAAHMNFAASQLALYEAGKDVVKQLASQGLNVAGQHLDQALTQTTSRDRGR